MQCVAEYCALVETRKLLDVWMAYVCMCSATGSIYDVWMGAVWECMQWSLSYDFNCFFSVQCQT